MASKKKKLITEESSPDSGYRNSHNLFWYSNLFNPIYLQNDVSLFHGEVPPEEEVLFETFLQQFQTFVETLDGENPNTWSEKTTIDRAIEPVLRILGYESKSNRSVDPWLEDESFTVQETDGLKTYKPDFIIANDHKFLKYIQNEKSDKKIEEARTSVILSIEAKYWGRIDEFYGQRAKEDSKRADKKSNSESSKGMDFDEQCLRYMEILNRPYGILTDGKTWRLYNLSFSTPNHRPYFQFNLGYMIKHVQNSDFLKSTDDYEIFKREIKYFYFLFRKAALYSESGEELFVDELLEYSKKYVARVEEDLKDRFVNAMTIACNGFQRAFGKANSDIELIRSVSESHIFNMLFLKYCETKNILPIKQDPEGYRRISISDVLDRIEKFDPSKEEDNLNELLLKRMFRDINYSADGVELYERLLKLTKIVQEGTKQEFKNFTIKGFKESIFSDEEWKFVNKYKLSNQDMIKILFEIGYSESDVQGRKYQQIPYNSFSPRQLGSIYESFLEFKLEKAPEDMAFIKKQWTPANLKSDKIKRLDIPKVKKGELFFTPNNKERKVTGSYYTPDCVVQFIVQETLESLTKGKSSNEILKMRVCDPAMGSGHFLSAALDFLARKYNDALVRETNDDISLPAAVVKREILHNCIYGVDINPRAVKLAKMSLWLESTISSEPLENLEDQIKCANSLTDESVWDKEWNFFNSGLDAVIGNPPYLSESASKGSFSYLRNSFLGDYYQGKSNLLNYFFHLGLKVLKDNGKLGFITTNYFLNSSSSLRLRKDLKENSYISKIINFENLKIFKDAKGQSNAITFLAKGSGSVTTILDTKVKGDINDELFNSLINLKHKEMISFEVPYEELFSGKDLKIAIKRPAVSRISVDMLNCDTKPLGEICQVNTGIQTGANTITDKHIEKYNLKNITKGTGIFVVSKDEVRGLTLDKSDVLEYIVPWFKCSDISAFSTNTKTNEYLIYLDRKAISIPKQITKHLAPFRKILEDRREVKNKVIQWFQLQWPREKEIFCEEKIVAPQRSKYNCFGYNNTMWFGATDCYFITSPKGMSLKYILGYLNSSFCLTWLELNGQKNGDMFALFQKALISIPIPVPSKEFDKSIVRLVEKGINANSDEEKQKIINEIDDLFSLEFKVKKNRKLTA